MSECHQYIGPGKGKYRGICLICKNANTCVFPRDPNRPLLYCDELELDDPLPKGTREAMVSSYADMLEQTCRRSKGSEAPLGLCKLCENREECTFPKPEGGVWHCEEYK